MRQLGATSWGRLATCGPIVNRSIRAEHGPDIPPKSPGRIKRIGRRIWHPHRAPRLAPTSRSHTSARLRPANIFKAPIALQQQPGNISCARSIALRNNLALYRPPVAKRPNRPSSMCPDLSPGRIEQSSLRRLKHPLRILAGINLDAFPGGRQHRLLTLRSPGIILRIREKCPKDCQIYPHEAILPQGGASFSLQRRLQPSSLPFTSPQSSPQSAC
jgi:hypothetical protein